jgi:hypothetical protein
MMRPGLFGRVSAVRRGKRARTQTLLRAVAKWRPAIDERRERAAFLSLLLVFALLAAPASQSLITVCDLCPPTCPMHRAEKAKHHKVSCHHGVWHPQRRPSAARAGAREVSFARTVCTGCGPMPAVSLGPMMVPGVLRLNLLPPAASDPSEAPPPSLRRPEPPDTPPPIVAL